MSTFSVGGAKSLVAGLARIHDTRGGGMHSHSIGMIITIWRHQSTWRVSAWSCLVRTHHSRPRTGGISTSLPRPFVPPSFLQNRHYHQHKLLSSRIVACISAWRGRKKAKTISQHCSRVLHFLSTTQQLQLLGRCEKAHRFASVLWCIAVSKADAFTVATSPCHRSGKHAGQKKSAPP